MPELPEVETIARGLAKRVTGDVIESVWLGEKPEPLKSSAQEIAAATEHRRVATIRRMGKHIVFDLDEDVAKSVARAPAKNKGEKEGHTRTATHNSKGKANLQGRAGGAEETEAPAPASTQFIVHLGMTGRLQVCEANAEIQKHTHAILKLASGRELRFVDPRRFGRLSVVVGDFDATGIEPLEASFDQFLPLFRGRKTLLKSALLNQNLLRGVGNIYADESLFRAGIRPRRRASSITRDQYAKLLISLQEVLREAIKLGGSSISDYVDADGEEGFFQLHHRVYGREGEPCLVCKTPIKRVVIGGRSSHYCPRCQK
jgi:formamidopyrimidine-DNA glycosylase